MARLELGPAFGRYCVRFRYAGEAFMHSLGTGAAGRAMCHFLACAGRPYRYA